jgi:hypothetical protein
MDSSHLDGCANACCFEHWLPEVHSSGRHIQERGPRLYKD